MLLSLGKLNLRSNAIGDRGAVAFGACLACNKSLKVRASGCHASIGLYLIVPRVCRVCVCACVCVPCLTRPSLLPSLSLPPPLQALYLGSNDIGPEGCASIAASWKLNNTLETLDLQGATRTPLLPYSLTLPEGRKEGITSGSVSKHVSKLANFTMQSLCNPPPSPLTYLPGITMGQIGGDAIADGIRANHSIRELIVELDSDDRETAVNPTALLTPITALLTPITALLTPTALFTPITVLLIPTPTPCRRRLRTLCDRIRP